MVRQTPRGDASLRGRSGGDSLTEQQQNIPDARVDTLVCSGCGTVLDVAGVEAFAYVDCPDCGFTSRVPVPFGPFLLVRILGQGGMGAVYKAYDPSLDRHVAIKVMLPEYGEDSKALEGFLREARAAAALNHTHVVHIYAFGQEDGRPYIAMELLEGGRMDLMLQESGRLGEARVMDIGSQVAEGLHAAYETGLIHGDIKPGNILFDAKGTAKLSDFGLAMFLERQEGRPSEVWGTPYYIAPEKVRRKPADHRADMYSLGGTLFHALTGRAPFQGKDAKAVVMARLDQAAPDPRSLRAGLTPETAQVMMRMLEENPSRRHPTYASLLADLRTAHHAAELAERDVEVRAAEVRRNVRRSSGAGVGPRLAGLTAILALSAIYLWWPGRDSGPVREIHHYEMRSGKLVPVYEDEVALEESARARAREAVREESRDVERSALRNIQSGELARTRAELDDRIASLSETDPDRVRMGLLNALAAACAGDADGSIRMARTLETWEAESPGRPPPEEAVMRLVRALANSPGSEADGSPSDSVEFRGVDGWVEAFHLVWGNAPLEARVPLEEIEASSPGEGTWLWALAPQARTWLDALTRWRDESKRVETLPAEEAIRILKAAGQEAIPALKEAIGQVLAETGRRLEVERAEADSEAARDRAEREARDAPRIAEALEGRLEFLKTRSFGELSASLRAVEPVLESQAGRDALALELERAERLTAMHRFLIRGVNAAPLAQYIEELGGRVARADNRGLYVATVDGGGQTPWSRVSSRLYLALFDHLVNAASLSDAEKADLCLSMAVYCAQQGGERAAARYRERALGLDPGGSDVAARLFPEAESPSSADDPTEAP